MAGVNKLSGRHYDVLKMDDTTTESSALIAKSLRAAVKSVAFSAFGIWWKCGCGAEITHKAEDPIGGVCAACFFRYQVMKAAGRLDEFAAAQKEKKLARLDNNEPIDIFKRKPLPARTGKTIQMYNYLGKPRKSK
jgi:hypothetical protein